MRNKRSPALFDDFRHATKEWHKDLGGPQVALYRRFVIQMLEMDHVSLVGFPCVAVASGTRDLLAGKCQAHPGPQLLLACNFSQSIPMSQIPSSRAPCNNADSTGQA